MMHASFFILYHICGCINKAMQRQCGMRSVQNPSLLKAFAAEVKARRGLLHISQDELAFRSGLSRTFLGKIEIAQNQPSLTALFCLLFAGEY